MEIGFVTGNKHKFTEVQAVLNEFNITIFQVNEEKIEPKEETIEKVAADNAKRIANKIGKPVIVDDTGVYFEAYENFPGANPKLMFESLGYKGLLKTVEGENRSAHFKTAIAFCVPNEEPKVFVGKLQGEIAHEAVDLDKDLLPYERIFLINGEYFSRISRDVKNSFSHRAQAVREFAKVFVELKNNRE